MDLNDDAYFYPEFEILALRGGQQVRHVQERNQEKRDVNHWNGIFAQYRFRVEIATSDEESKWYKV